MNNNKKEQEKMIDIVFAQRNKAYGAYEMRSTYNNTLVKSMVLATTFFILLIYVGYKLNKPEIIAQKVLPQDIIDIFKNEKVVEIDLSKSEKKSEKSAIEKPIAQPKGQINSNIAPIVSDNAKDTVLLSKIDDTTPIGIPEGKGNSEIPSIDPKSGDNTKGGTEIGGEGHTPLDYSENMPEFLGGDVLGFIKKKVNYPQQAINAGLQQTFSVRFIVDEEGNVKSPEILTPNIDPILASEAKRVINLMPKWKPGKNNNKAVKVYFTVPFRFKLSN